MTRDEMIETMARCICREKCAFMGEPPCFEIDGAWPPETCCEPGCVSEATAALTALERAGLLVVPVEPTEAMVGAGWDCVANGHPSGFTGSADIYRAMTAARPTA